MLLLCNNNTLTATRRLALRFQRHASQPFSARLQADSPAYSVVICQRYKIKAFAHMYAKSKGYEARGYCILQIDWMKCENLHLVCFRSLMLHMCVCVHVRVCVCVCVCVRLLFSTSLCITHARGPCIANGTKPKTKRTIEMFEQDKVCAPYLQLDLRVPLLPLSTARALWVKNKYIKTHRGNVFIQFRNQPTQ